MQHTVQPITIKLNHWIKILNFLFSYFSYLFSVTLPSPAIFSHFSALFFLIYLLFYPIRDNPSALCQENFSLSRQGTVLQNLDSSTCLPPIPPLHKSASVDTSFYSYEATVLRCIVCIKLSDQKKRVSLAVKYE